MLAEKIKKLTIELTKIPSVVGTSGEIDISKKIYEIFADMPYYKQNPDLLSFLDFKNDTNVVAIVKGEKASRGC